MFRVFQYWNGSFSGQSSGPPPPIVAPQQPGVGAFYLFAWAKPTYPSIRALRIIMIPVIWVLFFN